MAKQNHDFFKEKKPWSEVKDELLGCYLKPYLQKILHTKHPVVYVDCFAGKGVFEDGKPGSPLIALRTMKECLEQTKMENCDIQPYFIDVNYAEDLRRNLHEFTRKYAKIQQAITSYRPGLALGLCVPFWAFLPGLVSLSTLVSLPGFLCPCVGSRALAGLLPLEAVTLYAVGLSVDRCEVLSGWLVFYLLRSDPLYMRHFCPVGLYKNMRKSTVNRTHQQHQPPGLFHA